MSTIVYVWVHPDGFSPEHPGHCAIKVKGTYISHHPGSNDGFKWNAAESAPRSVAKLAQATSARTSRQFSYEEDWEDCGRCPEYEIELIGLANEASVDAAKLKNAFQGIKYSFAGQMVRGDAMNCVQCVMTCLDLLAGGRLQNYNSVVIPEEVATYAYALKEYLS